MADPARAPKFVAVRCPCGRDLRTKSALVGTEIRCWDCHAMVLVPLPRQDQKVVKELSVVARDVIEGPGMHKVLGAAAILTAILAIPKFGTYLSIVALTLGASAYGEIIRRVSRRTVEKIDSGWKASLLPRTIPKFFLCLLLASGTVIPLWIWKAGDHQSPHMDRTAWIITGLTWVILPLLMLITYGTKPEGPAGLKRFLVSVARHPFAILLSLAMVPLTLAIVEAALVMIFSIPGHLSFFALDFMPIPKTPGEFEMFNRIPHYDLVDYRELSQAPFQAAYKDGLRQGYSFVSAVPASLSLSTRAGIDSAALLGIPEVAYTAVRVLISLIVVTCLVAAFAVQARWLGSIPNLGWKRPA